MSHRGPRCAWTHETCPDVMEPGVTSSPRQFTTANAAACSGGSYHKLPHWRGLNENPCSQAGLVPRVDRLSGAEMPLLANHPHLEKRLGVLGQGSQSLHHDV